MLARQRVRLVRAQADDLRVPVVGLQDLLGRRPLDQVLAERDVDALLDPVLALRVIEQGDVALQVAVPVDARSPEGFDERALPAGARGEERRRPAAQAGLGPGVVEVLEHGPGLTLVCHKAAGDRHALLLEGSCVGGEEEVEEEVVRPQDHAEVAVAADEVAVRVIAVDGVGVLDDEAAVLPGQAVVVGDGRADYRSRQAAEVRGLEVVPAVEDGRIGVAPDRLQPDGAWSLDLRQLHRQRVRQVVDGLAGAAKRLPPGGVEDRQGAVVPEQGAVGIDERRELMELRRDDVEVVGARRPRLRRRARRPDRQGAGATPQPFAERARRRAGAVPRGGADLRALASFRLGCDGALLIIPV